MRKLLVALAMVPTLALANSFSMPNQNGGEIVITDRPCTFKGKTYDPLKHAYSYWNGGLVNGCWMITDNMIEIIWIMDQGDPEKNRRFYNPSDFTRKSGTGTQKNERVL
jgi:hypothetical protein